MLLVSYDSIFKSSAEVLVNPVNTVGIMGAGLALQFKMRYPAMYVRYRALCDNHSMRVGAVVPIPMDNSADRYIVCFPTKRHYRDASQLQYIEDGLIDLRSLITTMQVSSIALPALGCGLGSLSWRDVEPLIIAFAKSLPDVVVTVYPPQ